MANFTYIIPEEYRSSFQGFVNPDQNKIYIGGPNSPIVNDDQARRLIMEVTGLDSNIVFTFAGGPQDLDFVLGGPLMNALIKNSAATHPTRIASKRSRQLIDFLTAQLARPPMPEAPIQQNFAPIVIINHSI